MLYVILAGLAAWVWGAVWYGVRGKAWMADAGLSPEDLQKKDPVPFIAAAVLAILCAGMMRHAFVASGVDSLAKAMTSGLGVGLFLVMPWVATNYLFAQRPKRLILIDGAYAVGGCLLISIVLSFGL